MSVSETVVATDWLETVLGQNATLAGYAPGGVWRDIAPSDADAPYVIVGLQSASDVLSANAIRLMSRHLYQIKAVGPTTGFTAIANADATIDAALKRVSSVVTSYGTIVSCFRESSILYSELVDGKQWTHMGGLYTIEIQAS